MTSDAAASPEPPRAADAFTSLDQLRTAHAALLDLVPDSAEALAAEHVDRIRQFLRRAAAAGRLIDTPVDRKQAQGLLDYWSATFYSQANRQADGPAGPERLPREETVLAEFQAGTVEQVAGAADDWFRRLPESDRKLVRRILVRLVRLRPETRHFRAIGVPRSELEPLDSKEKLDALLDGLMKAGVVRIEAGEKPEDDRVSLRYEAISRAWKPYADWLDQRLRFRDAASYWEASDRDRSALIRDSLLDEAMEYQDRNGLEERYVAASRERERSQNWATRIATGVLAVVALAAAIAAAVAWHQMSRANREEQSAREQQAAAESQRKRADEAAQEAKRRADEAERAGQAARRAESALKAKFKLSYMVTFTRTLAEIGTAGDDAERLLAVHRLEVLSEGLRDDRDFAPILTKLAGDLGRVREGTASSVDLQRIALLALSVGRTLKAGALEVQDPDLIAELKAQRILAYRTARFCAEQIVATIEKQPFMAADAYNKEFWLLYWGELGIVEGAGVESAMVKFGRKLREIEQGIERRLPDAQKLLQPQQWARYQAQHLRAKIDTLRSEFSKQVEPSKILKELMSQKAPAGDVAELRRILQDQLIPALTSELNAGIAPDIRPPASF